MIPEVTSGKSFPLGATVEPGGVNFCLFSKHAEAVELLLFDEPNSPQPSYFIPFHPRTNKTFYYWHIFVKGLQAGQIYAYRVYGPFAPEKGHRFDGEKVLLDPYAKAIVGDEIYDRNAARQPGDNCAQALRGVVVDPCCYDWEDDALLRIPYAKSVIYEIHVGGLTRNPNSGIASEKRGTYAGLIEKIPYLQEIGITAVELLPIHSFDLEDAPPGLSNYWGYSTISFFAPHRAYSSRKDPLGPVNEFRDMVKALHKAGIEVILDVVFNHTAEGNHTGPTLCFRGIDNETYYILEANKREYSNYSGCGNTFKANHPIPGGLILNCLRYWVSEMHVDGFRFDLASVLTRDVSGQPIKGINGSSADILWSIESDPILAGTKLIAEAWDAAGLYSVGKFVELADWFAEWNGPFRDDVRRFVRGDSGTVKSLAERILGSPDIYPSPDADINRSINFITCHDGFTLNDLVSYNNKHNQANGEGNQDGTQANYSWNCGVEGETNDPAIEALRQQQMKNFFTILFFSQGTPMILMGDGIRRSQKGNNNGYCQDNELSWFDWEGYKMHEPLMRFLKEIIYLTRSLVVFQEERRLEVIYASHNPHLIWHGVQLGKPDWSDGSHSLAFTLRHRDADEQLHVMLNAYREALTFELPLLGRGERWHRLIDTALPSPQDFYPYESAPAITEDLYRLEARSSVVLIAKPIDLKLVG